MSRVKRGFKARRRRKKLLDTCKGYKASRSKTFRVAKETALRAGVYAYRDRKQKKRTFRTLWIARINAASRMHGIKYSTLIHWMKLANVDMDRRVLADMALHDPSGFETFLKDVEQKAIAA
jgi:large subunit ribosomal protein L20